MSVANNSIRAEVFKRANAKYPDPGVGKDVQYRNPGSGGTDEPMLITDPNTGEIYRVGGARSANQMRALKPSKIQQEQPAPKKQQPSAPKEQKMGPLRKAGAAFRKFDDAYSNKILNMYANNLDKIKASGREPNPLEKLGTTLGVAFGGAVPSTRKFTNVSVGGDNPRIEEALQVILPGVSAVSKYVAPAAGITLAGKALIDLTAAYGSKADQPQPMQLTMG